MHYVYKYVLDDEIIYIGKSDAKKPFARLQQHGISGDNIPCEYHSLIKSADIFYCELPNNTMTDVVETELIRRYKPKLNRDSKATSEWCGLAFVEPEWTKYHKEKVTKKNKKRKLLKQVEASRTSVANSYLTISHILSIRQRKYSYYYVGIDISGHKFICAHSQKEKEEIINGFTIDIDGFLHHHSSPPIDAIGEIILKDNDIDDDWYAVYTDLDALEKWIKRECEPMFERLNKIEIKIRNQ